MDNQDPDMDDVDDADQLYKVLVIGDYGVGKTSVIRRYTEGFFTPNYKLTIGVDFALKNIDWDDQTKISLQLWDIAGHERFGHMTHVYYKYAIAAIIVFDLGRPATFESVIKWQKDLNEKVMLANEDPVPTILLANKCDLSTDIDTEKLDKFCEDNNFLAWFATSAKVNKNIELWEYLATSHTVALGNLKVAYTLGTACVDLILQADVGSADRVYLDEAMQFLVEAILKVAKENQQPTQPENFIKLGTKQPPTLKERFKQQFKCCEGS